MCVFGCVRMAFVCACVIWAYVIFLSNVIGSEKRDHFALNAKFYRFSNTHHSDSP